MLLRLIAEMRFSDLRLCRVVHRTNDTAKAKEGMRAAAFSVAQFHFLCKVWREFRTNVLGAVRMAHFSDRRMIADRPRELLSHISRFSNDIWRRREVDFRRLCRTQHLSPRLLAVAAPTVVANAGGPAAHTRTFSKRAPFREARCDARTATELWNAR
jgi:hypothetical protein